MTTEKDLIAAILEAKFIEEDAEDGRTSEELAEDSGLSRDHVRRLLRDMVASGDVDVVWVKRPTLKTPLTGRMAKRPGYRFVPRPVAD